MLMATNEATLKPISSALSPEDFSLLCRRALEISATLDGCNRRRNAEVYSGVTPHWHVATVLPGKERTAAEDLSERAFGVYLPEFERTVVWRGRKFEQKRLMLPGYVLVFVWDIDRHMDRIRDCDGVRGLLFMNGQALILPDTDVYRLRVRENAERPIKGLSLQSDAPVKKAKRCWRKKRKDEVSAVQANANDIVGVHSYSPFLEELRAQANNEQLGAFHSALERALQVPAESA